MQFVHLILTPQDYIFRWLVWMGQMDLLSHGSDSGALYTATRA